MIRIVSPNTPHLANVGREVTLDVAEPVRSEPSSTHWKPLSDAARHHRDHVTNSAGRCEVLRM